MSDDENKPPESAVSGDFVRVCFCHAVSEGEIRQCIRDGAHTLEAIQAETCASTGCGGCQPEVERILADELAKLGKK